MRAISSMSRLGYVTFLAQNLARRHIATSISSTSSSCLSAATVKRILDPPSSAYLHLPFCAQRCYYCNFTVNISTDFDLHQRYIESLLAEIRQTASRARGIVPLRTLYLGGGTPSLLSPEQISSILETLRTTFGIDRDAEVTIEMDPATFDLNKAISFHQAGATRVSVGAQSTHDSALSACGRLHRRDDVFAALNHLERAGFTNVSVDVISGLPNVSEDQLLTSIREVTSSSVVTHISVYDLALEPGTPFSKRYSSGIAPLPTENDSVNCLTSCADLLRSLGYTRYEISNYAKGEESRSKHNLAYWNTQSFYGFGVGATSMVDGVRFRRPTTISKYERFVREGAISNEANNNEQEWLEDFIINRMRLLVDGLVLSELGDDCADAVVRAVEDAGFAESGLIEFTGAGPTRMRAIRVTDRGALLENQVLGAILERAVWNTTKMRR